MTNFNFVCWIAIFKCVLAVLKCISFAVTALWEALVKSCFPVNSDCISGFRSWISNVILQRINKMMILKNIPQGVIKRIKVFYDGRWSSLLVFVVGKTSGCSFYPSVGIFFLDESLKSVSGLTNATWLGFIWNAMRSHCSSGLTVWLMQYRRSLLCISLCRCQP